MSTYTKISRRDYVREGFCPTLAVVAGVCSNLTQPSDISYFSLYKHFVRSLRVHFILFATEPILVHRFRGV